MPAVTATGGFCVGGGIGAPSITFETTIGGFWVGGGIGAPSSMATIACGGFCVGGGIGAPSVPVHVRQIGKTEPPELTENFGESTITLAKKKTTGVANCLFMGTLLAAKGHPFRFFFCDLS